MQQTRFFKKEQENKNILFKHNNYTSPVFSTDYKTKFIKIREGTYQHC